MGRGNESLFTASGSHDKDAPPPLRTCIWQNPLKIFFSGTKGPMALEPGMQHWGHGCNKVRKNVILG